MGPTASLPPTEEGALPILVAHKNTSPSVGIKPAKFWFNGKNATHYTTDDNFVLQLCGCYTFPLSAVLT
jgi:hypothetical protein